MFVYPFMCWKSVLAKVYSIIYTITLLFAIAPATRGGYSVAGAGQYLFYLPPLSRSTAPKLIPLPRERWCSRRRPHYPHSFISCVCVCFVCVLCVCFRERRLYCLTAAALRRKSFLSVPPEGCHYCWTLNIIIRGYKLRCCQGWSACHKGVIIFVHSSLVGRPNIWIILFMRHVTPKWILNAVLLSLHIGSLVL